MPLMRYWQSYPKSLPELVKPNKKNYLKGSIKCISQIKIKMMAIVHTVHRDSKVFFQEWNEDADGESAIVITAYTYSVVLQQGDNSISISIHELKSFIKELQKIK